MSLFVRKMHGTGGHAKKTVPVAWLEANRDIANIDPEEFLESGCAGAAIMYRVEDTIGTLDSFPKKDSQAPVFKRALTWSDVAQKWQLGTASTVTMP